MCSFFCDQNYCVFEIKGFNSVQLFMGDMFMSWGFLGRIMSLCGDV